MSEVGTFVKSLLGMFSGRFLRIFRSIGHFMVVLGLDVADSIFDYYLQELHVRADIVSNLKIPLVCGGDPLAPAGARNILGY